MSSPFEPGLIVRLQPRTVAVFRASRIGDFVCATPALRALRAAMPFAAITLVGLPLVRDLAARCASIDRFEPFPGAPGIAGQFFEPARALDFFVRMQADAFDLVIQMHGSGVYSNPIALMLGGRATAGFIRRNDPPNHLAAAYPVPDHLPEIRRLLAFTAFLGAPARGEHTEFPLEREDEHRADEVLRGHEPPYIGLQPGAREATKRWPADRFAAVANALVGRHGGTAVVLGAVEERDLLRNVAGRLRVPHLTVPAQISLPVLGAVVGRLSLLVSNDSGPAHIAYALGTPTVTVFGGTAPWRWQPLVPGPFRLLAHHVPCRPCDYASCPFGDACLRAVTTDEVVATAEEVMWK